MSGFGSRFSLTQPADGLKFVIRPTSLLRTPVRFNSSIIVRSAAIFSLLFSHVLILTHHHAGQDCCPASQQHTAADRHFVAAPILGLELLPQGDCDCPDHGTPEPTSNWPADDHDHDSCSICKMEFEEGLESVEFPLTKSNESSFDFIPPVVQAAKRDIVSEYFTRGPPALHA